MKIAFLQFAPAYLEAEANLERAEALLGGTDADLVVLPELFTSGYFFRSTDDARAAAEPIPGGSATRWLKQQASETGATLVAGLVEEAEGRLFNSAVVVSPERIVGTYRKTHLYYEEKLHFAPGDSGLRVFDVRSRKGTPYRLGVMICFDWIFPEAARSLAVQGADVIAHPSNLVLPHCPRAMPVRALENHVFTVTANRYGTESNGTEELTFIGQSLICDPGGEVLLQTGPTGDALGSVQIDIGNARSKCLNAHNDLLADRRPHFYAAWSRLSMSEE